MLFSSRKVQVESLASLTIQQFFQLTQLELFAAFEWILLRKEHGVSQLFNHELKRFFNFFRTFCGGLQNW